MFLCYTPLDCIFILFATILHEEVLTWISFACSGAALCCRCVCTGLCENRLCVSEFRPVLYGSDCSVQTHHPHCRLLFVGLHDLQTELAVALFLLWSLIKSWMVLSLVEQVRSLNPVNVLLSEVFLWCFGLGTILYQVKHHIEGEKRRKTVLWKLESLWW